MFNVHFIYKAHINTTNVDHSAVHETMQNNNKITFKILYHNSTQNQIKPQIYWGNC